MKGIDVALARKLQPAMAAALALGLLSIAFAIFDVGAKPFLITAWLVLVVYVGLVLPPIPRMVYFGVALIVLSFLFAGNTTGKGLLVLGWIGYAVLLWTFLDGLFGDRVREYYDRNEKWAFPSGFVTVFAVCLLLAIPLDAAKQELGFIVGYTALMAMGLNIVVGFAGLLDLGYVAFFAVGAYTMGILSNAGPLKLPWDLDFWVIIPIGIVIALITGVVLGGPTLRLRGDYLAIVTLGFGEIVRIVAENLEGVTRGAKGLTDIPSAKVPLCGLFGNCEPFGAKITPYYIIIIVFIALFVLVIRRLNHSRVGRAWAAIREDEVAAEAMGVATLKYKLWAFAIGACTATVGGVIYGARLGFVSPESFQLIISIFILSSVVLGGLGNTVGAIVGAIAITVVPEMLRSLPERLLDARFGIFGLALVLMMIFRPQGLVPSRRRTAELKGGIAEDRGPLAAGLPAEAEVGAGAQDIEAGEGDGTS